MIKLYLPKAKKAKSPTDINVLAKRLNLFNYLKIKILTLINQIK